MTKDLHSTSMKGGGLDTKINIFREERSISFLTFNTKDKSELLLHM